MTPLLQYHLIGMAVAYTIIVWSRCLAQCPRYKSEWFELAVFAFVLSLVWPIIAACSLFREMKDPWRRP